jgi:hypothetical protein
MTNASKFQRGSGCYTCYQCGRKTRATGQGDNEHVQLCVECYEIAGIENTISDRAYFGAETKESCLAEIAALKKVVAAKGGKL